MRNLVLLSVLLASVSGPALAASTPEQLKSQLAAAREEAAKEMQSSTSKATSPGGRQKLAEIHASDDDKIEPLQMKPLSSDLLIDKPSDMPSAILSGATSKTDHKTTSNVQSKLAGKDLKLSDNHAEPMVPSPLAPVMPKAMPAPVAPAPAPLKTIQPSNNSPKKDSFLPLPQEMPPLPTVVPARTISVSNPAATRTVSAPLAKNLNTVRPAVGSTMVSSAPRMPALAPSRNFQPPAAAAKGPWHIRSIDNGSKNSQDTFCLMENRFDNGASLMIGQRADGYSTLGLNYGIDMLQTGRNYQIEVQTDNDFGESFMGYAESGHTLIVQMGKKRSFFDMLPNAQAVHVRMPGTASTFSMQGATQALNDFSSCLTKIGGNAINPATPAPMMAQVPVAPISSENLAEPVIPAPVAVPVAPKTTKAPIADMPISAKPAFAPIKPITPVAPVNRDPLSMEMASTLPTVMPKAVAAPAPSVAPAITAEPLPAPGPAPKTIMSMDASLPATMPKDMAKPDPLMAPVTSLPDARATSVLPEIIPTELPPVVAPVAPHQPPAMMQSTNMMNQSSVLPTAMKPAAAPMNLGQPAEMIPVTPATAGGNWSQQTVETIKQAGIKTYALQQNTSVVEWTDASGKMHGQAWHAAGNDLIDAATSQLDQAEKACKGNFSSQIGVPDGNVMLMETKCEGGSNASVGAWIVQQKDNQVTAWQMESPRDNRDAAFQTRDQLLTTLRK